MSAEELEQLVAAFLDRRVAEPDLSPEEFARELDGSNELLAGLHAALGVERALLASGEATTQDIGPYRSRKLLGRGGMGLVFEVEREGRRYALKRLHPSLAGTRARARFLREVELLRRLEHPGIVAVRDVGSQDGEPYLVMDLVDGSALTAAAAGWPLERKLRALIELCAAVQAAHAHGLLHRDLKPQNVLVRPDGSCVLVDFGLGVAEDDATLTSSGDLLGTPRYMAPEQARGEAADARTDVWGLGQILFELATGRPAIEASSRASVLRAVEEGLVPRPRRLRPDLPRDLERIVRQALAHDPARRYPSAAALAEDLERLLSGESVRARPPGSVARAWRRVRRKPGTAAALLGAPLVGAALLLHVHLRGEHERRAAAETHLERALLAWTSGGVDEARREAEAALEVLPDEPHARALLAALGDEASADASDVRARAFRALDDGRPREAAGSLAALPDADAFDRLLAAHAWRVAGDTEQAAALLERLAAQRPRSAAVAAEHARALRERGEASRAVEELARAIGIAPDDLRLRLEHAQALIAAGEVEAGVDAALEAARLDRSRTVATPTELARILGRGSQAERLRSALRLRLEREPGNADARFALAVSHDSRHEVREAAVAYEAVVDADPAHAWALAYLGHLRAGADRRHCADCRSVFEREPDLIDREVAGGLLAEAVRADRGRDQDLTRLIVFLARDHDLRTPALEAIDEALRGELTALQKRRLLDARAGLGR